MQWGQDLSVRVRFCTRCSLWKGCTGPVPPDASNLSPEVVVIGQNPGKDEDVKGAPFVGASGIFLNNTILPALGLSREQAYVTNAVKCYATSDKITPFEVQQCSPFLRDELKNLQSPKIIVLGKVAWGAISKDSDTFSKVVNKPFISTKHSAIFIVLRHPAYYLRDDERRDRFVNRVLPQISHAINIAFSVLSVGGRN